MLRALTVDTDESGRRPRLVDVDLLAMTTSGKTYALPTRRVLPDHEDRKTVAAIVREHGSDQKVADAYGVSRQAAQKWRQRAKVAPANTPRNRGPGTYEEFIPWRIADRHAKDLILSCLRLDARKLTGGELSPGEVQLLTQYRAFCAAPTDGQGKPWRLSDGSLCGPVVARYDRNDVDGFWLVPAKPGETGLIRRPGGPFDQ